jgi:hypothetical protein
MHPARLRCESSESAAADSCVFAPCQSGASTPKIVNLFFLKPITIAHELLS